MWVSTDHSVEQAVEAVGVHTRGLEHLVEDGRRGQPLAELVLVRAQKRTVSAHHCDARGAARGYEVECPQQLHDHLVGARTRGQDHAVVTTDMFLAQVRVDLAVGEGVELDVGDVDRGLLRSSRKTQALFLDESLDLLGDILEPGKRDESETTMLVVFTSHGLILQGADWHPNSVLKSSVCQRQCP